MIRLNRQRRDYLYRIDRWQGLCNLDEIIKRNNVRPDNMRKYLLHILIISFVLFSMPFTQAEEETRINLRSSFEELPVSQVHAIPNISIRKWKPWGFYGYSTISHDYKVETIKGEKVVIDHVTGLMWHQSGSRLHMNWAKAKQWIKDLNSSEYAGYNDWRLPTVEEAVSLLEKAKKSDNIYIDTVFDKNQLYIWTGDSYGSRTAWVVSFRNGQVTWIRIDFRNYVRPIRTMK